MISYICIHTGIGINEFKVLHRKKYDDENIYYNRKCKIIYIKIIEYKCQNNNL